jgi:splicing factor 3B subunit 3
MYRLFRLTKVPMVAGGRDILCYTTLAGSVGALIPFATKDDVEFMTTLEMVSGRCWLY